MVEFTGNEFGVQQIQWERGLQEQFSRQEQRRTDESIERQQQLHRDLIKAEARIKHLQQENEQLRADNDQLRLKYEKLESRAPQTVDSMRSLSLRHAAIALPRFGGSEGAEFATAWLKAIDRSSKAFNWTEAEIFLVGSVALEGSARQWLLARRRDVSTWREFKVAFKRRYAKSRIVEEVGPLDE